MIFEWLIGDFNANVNESSMKEFCNIKVLRILINEPTCFKNPEKATYIDLILTNRPTYFQLSTALELTLQTLICSQLQNLL